MSRHLYPNSSCYIDAREFLYWARVLSPEQVATVTDDICDLLVSGRFDKAKEQYPFIVRTLKGWQKRRSLPTSTRRKVLSAGICRLCGTVESLTVDHIKPVSHGGTDEVSNLQCLCWKCNKAKGPQKNGKTTCNNVLPGRLVERPKRPGVRSF